MSTSENPQSLEREVAALRVQLARLELRVSELEAEKGSTAGEGFEFLDTEASESRFSVVSKPIALNRQEDSRRAVLEEIGRWIRSVLDGKRWGLSGREKLREGTSVYLIVRDFVGHFHNPPIICKTWGEASRLVKPRGVVGDSVFVGLPTTVDCDIVCGAAGLEVSSSSYLRK